MKDFEQPLTEREIEQYVGQPLINYDTLCTNTLNRQGYIDYLLMDDGGANYVEIPIALSVGTKFLHDYGYYEVRGYSNHCTMMGDYPGTVAGVPTHFVIIECERIYSKFDEEQHQ